MRRWIKPLLIITGLTLLLGGLTGYRLTPASAAGARGTVLRTVPFNGGAALLTRTGERDCRVTMVRRFGPVWWSEGWSECMWEDRSHPFVYTGRGTGWKAGDQQRWAMAIGGIISDDRITAMRMAGHREQAVSRETGYLFVSESPAVTGFPATQALTADGSVLYTMHYGNGWQWLPPPTPPPLPERVTKQTEVKVPRVPDLLWAEESLSSVWQNGEVQVDGQWQPFYVWADGRPGLCALGTAVKGTWQPWYQAYPCPENLGALRITGIDPTGRTLSFMAPDGRTGRFDLATSTWQISEGASQP